jgi:hypothetical protein
MAGRGIWSASFRRQATLCGHSCDMSNPKQGHPTPKHPQFPASQLLGLQDPPRIQDAFKYRNPSLETNPGPAGT